MTNNQFFCDHKWEHFCSAEDQYMHCTNCGLRNPIGLFQHWDSGRDGPAVKWPPRDSGGKLPAGLTTVINRTGRPILIWPFNKKRRPIIKLRKERQGVFDGLWKWKCRQCSNTWGTSGIWEYAINDGHTHAIMKHALPEYLANHHRSQE